METTGGRITVDAEMYDDLVTAFCVLAPRVAELEMSLMFAENPEASGCPRSASESLIEDRAPAETIAAVSRLEAALLAP